MWVCGVTARYQGAWRKTSPGVLVENREVLARLECARVLLPPPDCESGSCSICLPAEVYEGGATV